jgi:hypothetical protein
MPWKPLPPPLAPVPSCPPSSPHTNEVTEQRQRNIREQGPGPSLWPWLSEGPQRTPSPQAPDSRGWEWAHPVQGIFHLVTRLGRSLLRESHFATYQVPHTTIPSNTGKPLMLFPSV